MTLYAPVSDFTDNTRSWVHGFVSPPEQMNALSSPISVRALVAYQRAWMLWLGLPAHREATRTMPGHW